MSKEEELGSALFGHSLFELPALESREERWIVVAKDPNGKKVRYCANSEKSAKKMAESVKGSYFKEGEK